MNNLLVAPSILAADFANLQRDIEMINQSSADWIHFDVMDGNFVPNISFGLPVCEAVNKHAQKPIDVHLMVEHPEWFIEAFQKAGATYITVHYEACAHLHRVIQQIKEAGCHPGVALNPHTPVSVLEDILPDLDMVLIMSVNPGFGGQEFIPRSLKKVEELKQLIKKQNLEVLIEVDGGVNLETGQKLADAGVNVLVAGSFVFKSESPLDTIKALKNVGS